MDNQCLVLHFQNGHIEYNWDDTTSGSCNGWDYWYTEKWSLCPDKDEYIFFRKPLEIEIVKQIESFLLVSASDDNYRKEGKNPIKIYRNPKFWEACHDERKPAMHRTDFCPW